MTALEAKVCLMVCHVAPAGSSAVPRQARFQLTKPNQAWSMDFVADQLADGRRFRALTVLDVFTRGSLAIEGGQRLRGEQVVATSAT